MRTRCSIGDFRSHLRNATWGKTRDRGAAATECVRMCESLRKIYAAKFFARAIIRASFTEILPVIHPHRKDSVMPTIKLHLEAAEYNAIERFAMSLRVKPEAVAYAALNRLMLEARAPVLQSEIAETWEWHRHNLPLWSDSACSVHAYEGMADDQPEPSRYT